LGRYPDEQEARRQVKFEAEEKQAHRTLDSEELKKRKVEDFNRARILISCKLFGESYIQLMIHEQARTLQISEPRNKNTKTEVFEIR
jgi:hypothetical protein